MGATLGAEFPFKDKKGSTDARSESLAQTLSITNKRKESKTITKIRFMFAK